MSDEPVRTDQREATEEEKAALKASIAKFGMLTPVVVDERSFTIDGFHRSDLVRSWSRRASFPPDYVPEL